MVCDTIIDNSSRFLRITELCREIDACNMDGPYQQEIELKRLMAAVRECWTAAFLSGAQRTVQDRYFTHQFLQLCKLFKQGHPLTSNRIISPLLLELGSDFNSYIDSDILITGLPRGYLLIDLTAKIRLVQDKIDKLTIDKKIHTFLCHYLAGMSGTAETVCTLGQIRYFKSFIEQLSCEFESQPDATADHIYEKLLELEFNQFDIFVFHQERLRLNFKGLNTAKKLTVMYAAIRRFSFCAKGDIPRYDQRWPSLSLMLLDWLKSEQSEYIKVAHQDMENPLAKLVKLPLLLPVSHLGFLLRLLYKEGVFGLVAVQGICSFFSKNFSTKRQEELSAGGLSKEYYTKNMVTAAEVRGLLSRMIAQINREYFPAWVVAGILIAGH